MLSYRHAFHAGNHADVLKHFVFAEVLKYFNQKDKPYWVVDTHAGAGMYALKSEFAQKNAEFESGIARLFEAKTLPEALVNYLAVIKSFNTPNRLDFYPVSPKIAQYFLRTKDKLRLFELHPSDFKLLQENFKTQSRVVQVEMLDGFQGIKACLPPPTKRAVVLIDPPYEVKDDYQLVVKLLKESLKRFPTGTYLIWYPLLQRSEPQSMVAALKELSPNNYLNVTLSVQTPAIDGFGMYGSGMFLINPPWTLPKILNETMPTLTDILSLDENAQFALDSQIA